MTSDESTEEKFVRAGQSAAALMTIALAQAAECDGSEQEGDLECLERMLPVFADMDGVDLAMANVWLARLLAQSLVEQYGSIDGAQGAVKEMAMDLVKLELEMETEAG